jgi:ubiquinone/menaquinone biosynthesis C-methylase UbiE
LNLLRISYVVAAVGRLPTRPAGFDSVTSAFALKFLPNPRAVDAWAVRGVMK